MKNTFLFNATTGSRSYNLLTSESDFDSVEVYLQNVSERLVFPDNKIKNSTYVFDGRLNEETSLEFTEFVKHCAAGDVKFVQVIYSDVNKMFNVNYDVFGSSVLFNNFLEETKTFVDKKKFVKNLLGIVKSNLVASDKMQSYKKLAESARCLHIAQEFLTADNFSPFLTGDVKQKIFDIKCGVPDFNECRNSLLLLQQGLLCAFDDYKPQTSKADFVPFVAGFYLNT